MISLVKSVVAVVGLSAAASASVYANGAFNVPEPGSLALVALAIGAVALVSRKGKK